jgi:tetratricopeptide (TPR) repeat protein
VRSHLARAFCCLAWALWLGAQAGPARAQGYGGAPPPAGERPAAGAKQPEEEKKAERRWGKREREKKKWGRPTTVSERTGKRLGEAVTHLQAERYDQAEAALGKLRLRGLNAFERAKVYSVQALIAYGKHDLPRSRDLLEKALAEEALTPEEQAQARFQIAQLYLAEEKWSQVVEHLNKWFATAENPAPAHYYLLALAYYQLEDLDKALEPAQKAVELAEVPGENWLQLLLAIRLSKRQYREAEPVLFQLVTRYPKRIYWVQLSTLYGAQGDYDRALVFLELAGHQGLLNEDGDVRRLAQLLLARDLPYPAAQILEQALARQHLKPDANAFELLSTAWIQARDFDKALEPLKQAAELTTDGKLYVRLAQLHLQREEWSDAENALRRALDKGGLASPGDAHLLMGITYYSQKRPDQALSSFGRAREHAETRDEAETWVKHIQQQLQAG